MDPAIKTIGTPELKPVFDPAAKFKKELHEVDEKIRLVTQELFELPLHNELLKNNSAADRLIQKYPHAFEIKYLQQTFNSHPSFPFNWPPGSANAAPLGNINTPKPIIASAKLTNPNLKAIIKIELTSLHSRKLQLQKYLDQIVVKTPTFT